MGRSDYWSPGAWNARCSMCGFKFKSFELTKNWQGMYRCSRCQETRHPQDFVRAVPDIQTPPWVQPGSGENWVAVCSPNGRTAIPGYATAGCALPGYTDPSNVIPSLNPGQV